MTLRRCCGALLAIVVACSHDPCGGIPGVVPGYPIKGIDGSLGPDGARFAFWNCQNRSQMLPVDSVTVRRSEDKGSSSVICEINATSKDMDAMLLSTWTYGSIPRGWRSSVCESLRAGEYTLVVRGAGSGVRRFAVTDNGELTWRDEPCK